MPTESPTSRAPRPTNRSWLDPGWMLLIAGVALLGAALILPAQAELRQAQIDRDVAQALYNWRQTHLENHRHFADRLEDPDDALLLSLVSTQLNMIPVTSNAVPTLATSFSDHSEPADDASPFAALLPAYQPPQVHAPFESILMKWTAHPRGQLLVLATGILLAFLGLISAGRTR